jgi:hypothetical protein
MDVKNKFRKNKKNILIYFKIKKYFIITYDASQYITNIKKKHKKQNTRRYKKLQPFHMLERGVE